jgi:hypothetical protein
MGEFLRESQPHDKRRDRSDPERRQIGRKKAQKAQKKTEAEF